MTLVLQNSVQGAAAEEGSPRISRDRRSWPSSFCRSSFSGQLMPTQLMPKLTFQLVRFRPVGRSGRRRRLQVAEQTSDGAAPFQPEREFSRGAELFKVDVFFQEDQNCQRFFFKKIRFCVDKMFQVAPQEHNKVSSHGHDFSLQPVRSRIGHGTKSSFCRPHIFKHHDFFSHVVRISRDPPVSPLRPQLFKSLVSQRFFKGHVFNRTRLSQRSFKTSCVADIFQSSTFQSTQIQV